MRRDEATRGERSRLGLVVVAGACLALGALGGMAVVSASASRRASPHAAEAPETVSAERTTVVAVGPSTARLGDDEKMALRALIREEFAAQKTAAEARADSGTGDPPARPTMSGEQLKSYDQGRALVDDGLARGVWTEEDRRQLHATIASLPTEERHAILGPLVVAVNAQKVRFEGRGPLF